MGGQYLHRIYKDHLSGYRPSSEKGARELESIPVKVDVGTGEVLSERPLYIFGPANMGALMCIDDKQIGKGSYTILSNPVTGKVALLIESVDRETLKKALARFPNLEKVCHICADMSPTYLKLVREAMPHAKVSTDKFHVIRYAYDVLADIRGQLKKQWKEQLSGGRDRTAKDEKLLSGLELLKRCRHLLNRSKEDWSQGQAILMERLFALSPELHTAYNLVQQFKQWYCGCNIGAGFLQIGQGLHQWYENTEKSKVATCFEGFIKMVKKHEDNIINYFTSGLTNAKAENLNGKIQRFIANNYGIKNKDFAMFRIATYFA